MLNSVAIATEGIGFGAGPIALQGFWPTAVGPGLPSDAVAIAVAPGPFTLAPILAALGTLGDIDTVTVALRYTLDFLVGLAATWGLTASTSDPRYTIEAQGPDISVDPECD